MRSPAFTSLTLVGLGLLLLSLLFGSAWGDDGYIGVFADSGGTIACTSVLAQTNHGYVGVFGDAAGTVDCVQAPPGVPTMLYVVGKLAGSTASGITGAEFRVEIENPGGYLTSYSAPSGSIALGSPLDAGGFNIAFTSCQPMSGETVALGNIYVFNTGTGSDTRITVKRKSPPTNSNYNCALFVQCNAPTYTKSCMTAPPDTSCLVEKVGSGRRTTNDEYSTSLIGGSAAASKAYLGYQYNTSEGQANCLGFEGAGAGVQAQEPIVSSGSQVTVWTGLQNDAARLVNLDSRWIQAGILKRPGQALFSFHEWMRRSTAIVNGIPDGWSGIRSQWTFILPGTWGSHLVERVGEYAHLNSNLFEDSTVPWAELIEKGMLGTAAWTGEVAKDGDDRMPGIPDAECKFDPVAFKKIGSDQWHTPVLFYPAEPQTQHGDKTSSTGNFKIWRVTQ